MTLFVINFWCTCVYFKIPHAASILLRYFIIHGCCWANWAQGLNPFICSFSSLLHGLTNIWLVESTRNNNLEEMRFRSVFLYWLMPSFSSQIMIVPCSQSALSRLLPPRCVQAWCSFYKLYLVYFKEEKKKRKCRDGPSFCARFQVMKRVQRAFFCTTRWPESPKESGQLFHLRNSCGSNTRLRKTITWWEQKESSLPTALASQKLR